MTNPSNDVVTHGSSTLTRLARITSADGSFLSIAFRGGGQSPSFEYVRLTIPPADPSSPSSSHACISWLSGDIYLSSPAASALGLEGLRRPNADGLPSFGRYTHYIPRSALSDDLLSRLAETLSALASNSPPAA